MSCHQNVHLPPQCLVNLYRASPSYRHHNVPYPHNIWPPFPTRHPNMSHMDCTIEYCQVMDISHGRAKLKTSLVSLFIYYIAFFSSPVFSLGGAKKFTILAWFTWSVNYLLRKDLSSCSQHHLIMTLRDVNVISINLYDFLFNKTSLSVFKKIRT